MKFSTPITLLLATVLVEEESDAYRLLGVEDQVVRFREPTTRTNVRYDIERITTHANQRVTIAQMTAYVKKQRMTYQKILVYVAFTTMAEELAAKLVCDAYHGKLANDERRSIQARFSTAESAVLVVTTAFNAGVHIYNIRMVIRFGKLDSLITWAQESGRAGRDQLPCTARVVLGTGLPSFIENSTPAEADIMHRYL